MVFEWYLQELNLLHILQTVLFFHLCTPSEFYPYVFILFNPALSDAMESRFSICLQSLKL